MFSEQELRTLAGTCYREAEFLKAIEQCGVPTAIQQGAIMSLRAKCVELADKAKKAEETKAKEVTEKVSE